MTKKNKLTLITCLAIFFLGLVPRTGITSVGFVSKRIIHDLRLSETATGFITTIPLLCFGLLSILAPLVNKKLGYVISAYVALIILFLGFAIRFNHSKLALFLGTIIVGLAVTLMNITVPAYIKNSHANQAGLLMTVYSISFSIAHALSSNLTVPLANHFSDWRWGMNAWIILIPFAFGFWFMEIKNSTPQVTNELPLEATNQIETVNSWKTSLGWLIALFFGLKSLLFYSLMAWLPAILQTKGLSEVRAGNLISIIDIVGFPLTIFFTQFLFKTRHMKFALTVAQIAFASGLILLLQPNLNFNLGIVMISLIAAGMAINGVTGYSLPLIKSNQALTTANLTAMSQTVGFSLAAFGSTLTGKLHESIGSWQPILIIGILICIIQFLVGYKIATQKAI